MASRPDRAADPAPSPRLSAVAGHRSQGSCGEVAGGLPTARARRAGNFHTCLSITSPVPAALPLWVLAYSLGILGFAGLEVRWSTARWCLAGAVIGLGLSLLGRRGKGIALLACALALGGLAQARRSPVLEIPARRAGSGPAAVPAAGELSLPELLTSAELLADAQWLCEGHVVEPAVASEYGTLLRIEVTALRRAPSAVESAERAQPQTGPAWLQVTPPLGVAVSVRGQPREPLLPGTPVRLLAALRSPRAAQNPGTSDRMRHASAVGTAALASVEPEALYPWLGPMTTAAPPARLHRAYLRLVRGAAQVHKRLLRQIDQALPLGSSGSTLAEKSGKAVVAALALGERGLLVQADRERRARDLPTIEDSFRGAGIYHVLSVSGLHLAVVAWIFYRLLARLLLLVPGLAERFVAHRLAALVALPPTLFYALLTGAELATQRAALAALLVLLAVGCGRRARLSQALAGAVLAIAFPVPAGAGTPALLLCEPALLLSVVATLAIAYLRPLGGLPASWRQQPMSRARALLATLRRGAWRLIESSLAAALATAPLCAWFFSEVQAAGVLGNLLPGLLGEVVVLPLGLFGSLLGLVWPAAGQWGLTAAVSAAAWMVRAATEIAQLGGVASVPAPHLLLALAWWLGLVLGAVGRRWGGFLCATALLGYLVLWLLPSGELRVTFLDVGQGDAIVAELPQGGVMVVDAGLASSTGVDFGERVVVPFLRRRGYRRIDLVVASHPHPDHTGGLTALLRSFPVRELWAVPSPIAELAPGESRLATAWADPQDATERSSRVVRELPDPAWPRLLQLAAQRHVALTPPRSRQLHGVQIEVLGPCRASSNEPCTIESRADWRPNDNSLVLRLSYAGRTILLPGDIELAAELALLDRLDEHLNEPGDRPGRQPGDRHAGLAGDPAADRPDAPDQPAGSTVQRPIRAPAPPAGLLQADVLKAPHHCSRTSSSESLVAAVRPQWVICSLGAYNRYRFPHAEVLRRYQDAGSRVLRTDADGAVEFRIDAAGNLRHQSFARPQ